MGSEINIRRGNADDHGDLGQIVHYAIRDGATRYTPAQRSAWSPEPRSAEEMKKRLGEQVVWLAEVDRRPIGFMTLSEMGYVDFAYILKEWRGKGVFRKLYEAIELHARSAWMTRLTTHASLHAFEAFRHFGFNVVYPETVEVSNVWLPRMYMEKKI
ncbi:MAG: GNAT family N-acetyltransferase [Pseudomonadota bacterium]